MAVRSRLLGSAAIDPTDPTNQALRLVATGRTEHMSNHIETTLADGAKISLGKIYEISFRAKWLSGSNQLNSRLYFNKLGRTTLLDTPQRSGTPGAPNGRRETNLGPTYSEMIHGPLVPKSDEAVTVSVRADDPDAVTPVA